ncbi:MAG TPA: PIN domain-containing protein [Candidatus Bathyarchaeota archaeon]|nr:MAG: hypothetical protein DRO60_01460 [Candidatus Bathyarchaeota archaeon]HDJ26191.1 PIN domain-containing protein [Candidatus Bathyarchaeota archaeon]
MFAARQRIYLDTNVLVAKVKGEEDRVKKIAYWERYVAEEPKRQLVVSIFTLMELLHVIRNTLARKLDPNTDLNQARNYVINESVSLFNEILEDMIRLPETYAIVFDVGVTISKRELELQYKYVGQVRRRRCECGESFVLRYGGVGHADMVHLAIARQLACDTFLTFDKGFIPLKEVVYPPEIIVL